MKKKKQRKKYTLKYKSCKHIPCGLSPPTHNNCKPSYCTKKGYESGAKNWSLCNMKNWYAKKTRKYSYYEKKCRTIKKNNIKKKNTKIGELQVDALTLHKKMPYIWRYLTPPTQKLMILIAKLPVKTINTWPSYKKIKKNEKNKKIKRYTRNNKKILKLLKKHNIKTSYNLN